MPQSPDHKPATLATASADVRRVAEAMALLWTFRPRTSIHNLLGLLGARRGDGRAFTQDDLRHAIADLRVRGAVTDMPGRDGFYRLVDAIRGPLYRAMIEGVPVSTLREALHRLDSFRPDAHYWPLYDKACVPLFTHASSQLMSTAPACFSAAGR